MLDTMNTVVSKLLIRIRRCSNTLSNGTVADIVKEIIFEQVNRVFGLTPEWESFLTGSSMCDEGNGIHGMTAALNSESYAPLWAMSIKKKDPANSRRRWNYHIGIRETDKDSILFYYALCRYDHLAGSIHCARPAPMIQDSFPTPLFEDPRIECMCGTFIYPTQPLELTDTSLPAFINQIQDEARTIPVVLISCPDVISPEEILSIALGNLVIYWTADPGIVERLNAILPEEFHTPWDSVRMLLPINQAQTYHPVYPYELISQMGYDAFLEGIHQAYCSSLRSEERRSFITVEDIAKIRDRRYITSLLAQIKDLNTKLADLREEVRQQESEKSCLEKELVEYRTHPLASEIKEYETLLNETLAENSEIKQGISSLSTQLYSSLGGEFHPSEEETVAVLQELAHAIRVALSCASSKK